MHEWMPIESAPRDGSFVLLYPGRELRVSMGNYYTSEDEDPEFSNIWQCMDSDAEPSWCTPTHWMPLPSPPESV